MMAERQPVKIDIDERYVRLELLKAVIGSDLMPPVGAFSDPKKCEQLVIDKVEYLLNYVMHGKQLEMIPEEYREPGFSGHDDTCKDIYCSRFMLHNYCQGSDCDWFADYICKYSDTRHFTVDFKHVRVR